MRKELLNLEINHKDNKDVKEKIRFMLKENKVPNIWICKIDNLINIIEKNCKDEQ